MIVPDNILETLKRDPELEVFFRDMARDRLLADLRWLVRYRELESRAVYDDLTGLYRHGELERFLNEEIDRAVRHYEPFGFVMTDLNGFKGFNDTYGHPAGDKALKTTADMLKKNVRKTDRVVRYGGDEFSIVMPHTDRHGALAVCRRIGKEMDAYKGFINGDKLTLAIGITVYNPKKDGDIEYGTIIDRADKAMYAAKGMIDKTSPRSVICTYETPETPI